MSDNDFHKENKKQDRKVCLWPDLLLLDEWWFDEDPESFFVDSPQVIPSSSGSSLPRPPFEDRLDEDDVIFGGGLSPRSSLCLTLAMVEAMSVAVLGFDFENFAIGSSGLASYLLISFS